MENKYRKSKKKKKKEKEEEENERKALLDIFLAHGAKQWKVIEQSCDMGTEKST